MCTHIIHTNATNHNEFRRSGWSCIRKWTKMGSSLCQILQSIDITIAFLDVFRYMFRLHCDHCNKFPTSSRTSSWLWIKFAFMHRRIVASIDIIVVGAEPQVSGTSVNGRQFSNGFRFGHHILLLGVRSETGRKCTGHWYIGHDTTVHFDHNFCYGSDRCGDAIGKSNENTAKLCWRLRSSQ